MEYGVMVCIGIWVCGKRMGWVWVCNHRTIGVCVDSFLVCVWLHDERRREGEGGDPSAPIFRRPCVVVVTPKRDVDDDDSGGGRDDDDDGSEWWWCRRRAGETVGVRDGDARDDDATTEGWWWRRLERVASRWATRGTRRARALHGIGAGQGARARV